MRPLSDLKANLSRTGKPLARKPIPGQIQRSKSPVDFVLIFYLRGWWFFDRFILARTRVDFGKSAYLCAGTLLEHSFDSREPCAIVP